MHRHKHTAVNSGKRTAHTHTHLKEIHVGPSAIVTGAFTVGILMPLQQVIVDKKKDSLKVKSE